MIEEVYRREVDHLATSATGFIETEAAGDALQLWLRLAVDYIATKKIIAPAITSTEIYGSAGARIADVLRGGSVYLNSSARLLSGASAGFMPLREAAG